jgi:hypothetical protein
MSFRPMRLNSKSESTFDTKEPLSAELKSSCTAAISDFACLEKSIITTGEHMLQGKEAIFHLGSVNSSGQQQVCKTRHTGGYTSHSTW